jgi:hypothetical protein
MATILKNADGKLKHTQLEIFNLQWDFKFPKLKLTLIELKLKWLKYKQNGPNKNGILKIMFLSFYVKPRKISQRHPHSRIKF